MPSPLKKKNFCNNKSNTEAGETKLKAILYSYFQLIENYM